MKKLHYQQDNTGLLKTLCKNRPYSGIRIGSANCSICKAHIKQNYVEQYVECSFNKKIK